jgi:hypothetical protein
MKGNLHGILCCCQGKDENYHENGFITFSLENIDIKASLKIHLVSMK